MKITWSFIFSLCLLMSCRESTLDPLKPQKPSPRPGSPISLGAVENEIYYSQYSNGTSMVYSIHPDGTNKRSFGSDSRVITSHGYGNTVIYIGTTMENQSLRYALYLAEAGNTEATRVLTTERTIQNAVLSPDQHTIVYVLEVPVTNSPDTRITTEVHKIKTDGTGEKLLEWSGALQTLPVWSPDGQSVAYVFQPPLNPGTAGDLVVMYSDGSKRTVLSHTMPPTGMVPTNVTWSPDGTKILAMGNSGLSVFQADGSGEQLILADVGISPLSVAWSPNGQTIAYGHPCGGSQPAVIKIMDALGNSLQDIFVGSPFVPVTPAALQWSPDGTKILFTLLPDLFDERQEGTLQLLDVASQNISTVDNHAFRGYWKK